MSGERIVVVGAGVGGLSAALALARQGNQVTVIDRDPPPPHSLSPADAFGYWDRRQVPQMRQPHNFLARVTKQLRASAPDVLETLAKDGLEAHPGPAMLIPPDQRIPEDDDIVAFFSRRARFELAFRRIVEQEPGVTIRCPVTVRELRAVDHNGSDSTPRIVGVTLDDGSTLDADWVVDAGGRRSSLRDQMGHLGARLPTVRREECDITYHTRHYRLLPDAPLESWMALAVRVDEGAFGIFAFGADDQTFSMGCFVPSWDEELRALRHPSVLEAVVRRVPVAAPWIDPSMSEPISDVATMAGPTNQLRDFVIDGRPMALCYLPVGDAFCTTNPIFAWGVSLAMTQAFAAATQIERNPDDPGSAAICYREDVFAEAERCFEYSAANDRLRRFKCRGESVPEADRKYQELEQLVREGIAPAVPGDPVLLRAFLRRFHLLDPPDAIFENEEVLTRAKHHQSLFREDPPPPQAPSREELGAIIVAASS
jgi:2-polyprenyl-6-methoxyphenol hydroxylase-like FAD-dependent oxidoreductase